MWVNKKVVIACGNPRALTSDHQAVKCQVTAYVGGCDLTWLSHASINACCVCHCTLPFHSPHSSGLWHVFCSKFFKRGDDLASGGWQMMLPDDTANQEMGIDAGMALARRRIVVVLRWWWCWCGGVDGFNNIYRNVVDSEHIMWTYILYRENGNRETLLFRKKG